MVKKWSVGTALRCERLKLFFRNPLATILPILLKDYILKTEVCIR